MTTTFSKAKREFGIRYYLWATSEFEREIDELFPGFHSFKAGTIWEVRQFMQQLNKDEQSALARGLLKRFHPEAVKHLGERCSTEEESLRSRCDDFFRIRGLYQSMQELERNGLMAEARTLFQMFRPDAVKILGETYLEDEACLRSRLDAVFCPIPLTFEEGIAAQEYAGEKIKFASKRKLRKVMTAKFKDAFGSQCFGLESVDDEEDLTFQMKCCGWIICTQFWFGRRESLLSYSHSIATEAMVMASLISFAAWLGITSQTQWEYLMEADVEPACDAVIKHCRHFFDVLPKLGAIKSG